MHTDQQIVITDKTLRKRLKRAKTYFNNTLDSKYQQLLFDVFTKGHKKLDRTGTGTISTFGTTLRHSMKEGFPLLTTKQMAWKSIVTELLWFLRGETNIQSLVKDNNTIWVGDAYKRYCKCTEANTNEFDEWMRDNGDDTLSMFTKEQFIEKIKTDDKFAAMWGEMGPIYGKQWIRWSAEDSVTGEKYEFNQLQDVVERIKTLPDDRRLLVTAWNPGELKSMVLPPCHILFQFWTRELTDAERRQYVADNFLSKETESNIWLGESLDWSRIEQEFGQIPTRAISLQWYQRSVDTPLGLPFNIASYALLLEIVANDCNMVSEDLIFVGGDTHIYTNQLNGVDEQLSRETLHSLPKLAIENSGNIIDNIKDINWSQFSVKETYKSQDKIDFPLSN